MRQVTAHSRHRLDAWWDAAINTPHVRRFLTHACWADTTAALGDGWQGVHYLDDACSTLLSVGFNRDARTEATVSLWCLHEDRMRRSLAAGQMLRRLPSLLQAAGAAIVHSTVHETNVESLALNRRLLGEPWGIQPEAGWDAVLRRLVSVHHFRRALRGSQEGADFA